MVRSCLSRGSDTGLGNVLMVLEGNPTRMLRFTHVLQAFDPKVINNYVRIMTAGVNYAGSSMNQRHVQKLANAYQ